MKPLANVDLIRRFIAGRTLPALRGYISMVGGNDELVTILQGPEGARMQARIADCILREFGHQTELAGDQRGSPTLNGITKALRRERGAV
jgi:hypothetical protein